MSEDEQKQAQALVLLRRAETKKLLATLKSEAYKTGEAFRALGDALSGSSDALSVDVSGNQLSFSRRSGYQTSRGSLIMDAARIKTLVDEINKATEEEARLHGQVKAMGLDV